MPHLAPRPLPLAAALLVAAPLAAAPFASLGLAPPSAAQDREAFAEGLAEVDRWMDLGRWEKAREELDALLTEHEGRAWVRARRTAIADRLARCAFWSTYEPPRPDDVVGGELRRFDPKRGRLEVRYRGPSARPGADGALPDFASAGEWQLHAARLTGPHRVELTGRDLPRDPRGGRELALRLCSGLGRDWVEVRVSETGTLVALWRGGRRTARAVEDTGLDGDARWRIEVDVREADVTVAIGGRRVLRADKPAELWGHLALPLGLQLDELELSGKAEPAWIEGRVDEAVQRAWKAFAAARDPLQGLPEWLCADGEGPPEPEEPRPTFPGPLGEAAERHAARARELDEAGRREELLAYADALGADEASPEQRAWLRGLALFGLGRSTEALAEMEVVVAAEPLFSHARVLHAMLVGTLRPRAELALAAAALARDFPAEEEVWRLYTHALLLDGRPEEARRALDRALELGHPHAAFASLDAQLHAARSGPRWSRTHEWTTRTYRVRSDLSKELCYEVADVLEEAFQQWNVHLRRIPWGDDRRFPVYVFSGRAGYQAYLADLLDAPPESTAGIYSPSLKQLVLWNVPEREELLRVARHEGFHQYLDQLVGPAPAWLNEGFAEYYETSERRGGRWVDGGPHPQHLATLRGPTAWTPLPRLLGLDTRSFQQRPAQHYAQAWALVHFLRHGGTPDGRRLDTLLDALVAGRGVIGASEAAFEGADLARLERELRAYVREL